MSTPTPFWGWCPQPGMSRSTALTVDSNAFGDGYIHRSTRGLNPARPTWQGQFPFRSAGELQVMDDFLTANAARGFWVQPPELAAPIFVCCDAWSMTIADRNISSGMVGTLQVSFVRSFNPQPIGTSP